MVRFFLFLLQSNNLDSVVLNLHGLSVSLVLMAAALKSMPGASQLVIAALHKGTEDGKRREAAALFCWVVGIWGEKLFLLWITECVIQTSGAEWSTSLGAQTEAPCESVAWQAQADVVSQSVMAGLTGYGTSAVSQRWLAVWRGDKTCSACTTCLGKPENTECVLFIPIQSQAISPSLPPSPPLPPRKKNPPVLM